MEAENSEEIQQIPDTPKKVLSESEITSRRENIKKAIDKKKELAVIKKAEHEKAKLEQQEQINQAKKTLEEVERRKAQLAQENIKPESEPRGPAEHLPKIPKKKTKKIIEKIIEQSDSDEEEVIERYIIKKSSRASAQRSEKDHLTGQSDHLRDDDVIAKTNKEMLLQQLKQQEKSRLMSELFSF